MLAILLTIVIYVVSLLLVELNFIINDIPSSRGVVYVDDTDPELIEVTVSACWNQGNRIIGEDTDLVRGIGLD